METVFQYRIPVWHPIVVHFSPAFLIVSVGVAGGWIVWGGSQWRRALLGMLTLSTLGTAFAYLSGEAMEQRSEGVPIVEELVELHEQLALYTLIGTGVALLCVSGVTLWSHKRLSSTPRWIRIVIGLIVAVVAMLVAFTAHVGGTMTWGVPA